jgi:hypothetical protein
MMGDWFHTATDEIVIRSMSFLLTTGMWLTLRILVPGAYGR